jgi:two-component system sensor histidine kinase PilS (NtrC family)
MLSTFNERTWLTWLVKARVIIITFVLGIELALVSFTPAVVSKRLFVSTIIIWYAVAAFYAVLLQLWRSVRLQARLQVLTDLAFATVILYATGGIDTSFNVLYPLIIIMAAIMLPRYWAFLTAMLAFVLFGSVVELCFYGIIPSVSTTHADPKSLQAVLLVNLFAYTVIAYLASRLSARLRQVHVQLQEKSGALENLQALHENIVKSMSGGVITTNLDGRITVVNPAGERLLGSMQSELTGTSVEEVFSGSPLPGVGTALATELSCHTPSGQQKTFSLRVSPLTAPGQGDVGRVYTFDDLTEIRRLEREVRVRDRMAAVGRMAAGIAHEIRNPLSSIAGSVHVLSEIATLNEEQRLLVDVVTRESERLNQIISNFLDYSRGREYHFAPLDLVVLLKDTLTLLSNRPEVCSRTARVEIVRDDIPSSPAWSLVDGDRMKQVFWNLCDNALRAMPDGGKLSVGLRPDGDNWRISFADTGTGVSPQAFDKIFEPFQSGFARGTGLGLAIVYEIVQAHEGRISVHSALGSGTEFILQLKRTAPQAVSAAAGAES